MTTKKGPKIKKAQKTEVLKNKPPLETTAYNRFVVLKHVKQAFEERKLPRMKQNR